MVTLVVLLIGWPAVLAAAWAWRRVEADRRAGEWTVR